MWSWSLQDMSWCRCFGLAPMERMRMGDRAIYGPNTRNPKRCSRRPCSPADSSAESLLLCVNGRLRLTGQTGIESAGYQPRPIAARLREAGSYIATVLPDRRFLIIQTGFSVLQKLPHGQGRKSAQVVRKANNTECPRTLCVRVIFNVLLVANHWNSVICTEYDDHIDDKRRLR